MKPLKQTLYLSRQGANYGGLRTPWPPVVHTLLMHMDHPFHIFYPRLGIVGSWFCLGGICMCCVVLCCVVLCVCMLAAGTPTFLC